MIIKPTIHKISSFIFNRVAIKDEIFILFRCFNLYLRSRLAYHLLYVDINDLTLWIRRYLNLVVTYFYFYIKYISDEQLLKYNT